MTGTSRLNIKKEIEALTTINQVNFTDTHRMLNARTGYVRAFQKVYEKVDENHVNLMETFEIYL